VTLETLVAQYGYPAIFIGALVEGETVLLIAAVLVQQGLMDLKYVLLASAAGAFVGDQFFFHLERFKGSDCFRHKVAWQRKMKQAIHLLERRRGAVVLCYRFIYGMRAVIPFLLGAGRCRGRTFALLSAGSAIVWALVIATGGYYFGELFERLIRQGQALQKGGLIGGACLVVVASVWRCWKRRPGAVSSKKSSRRNNSG
jgi:membrane protein DedA with SNARE-associated domain